MKTLPKDHAPYIETDKRPEEILGNYYQLFVKHYRAWLKCDGSDTYMAKAFTTEERNLISKLNEELLYAGYRIDKISGSGEIEWLVMTLSIKPNVVGRKLPPLKNSGRKIPADKMIGGIGKKMPEGESG